MKYLSLASAMAVASVNANSTPLYSRQPGWTVGGGQAQITLEFFYDFLCSDSLAVLPVISDLLSEPFNGSTVDTQVTITYTPFPLDYHVHSW